MPKLGLEGRKLAVMKAFIAQGLSVEEVAAACDVFPEFVEEYIEGNRHIKVEPEPLVIEVPEEIVSTEEPAPLEEPQDDDPYAVKSLDDVDLKTFRKWIQDNLYADLPNNATRKTCIREYMTRV